MEIENRKIIFRAIVGSHAYGLNTPTSDKDYISVYLPTKEDLLGLNRNEQFDQSSKGSNEKRSNTENDTDDHAYSLQMYTRLLLQNNPNIIETLFVPPDCIEIFEPEMFPIITNYDKIVSQLCRKTFIGYATSQKHKAVEKVGRYFQLKRLVEYFELNGMKSWNFSTTQSTIKGIERVTDCNFVNNQHGEIITLENAPTYEFIYKNALRDYESYGTRIVGNTIAESVGYETKAAYHLVRIMEECLQIWSNGKIIFPFIGEAREDILAIKQGKMNVHDLLSLYEGYEKEIKRAEMFSTLREKPDFHWMNQYVVDTLYEYLRGNGK